jgi:2-oxo-3-hexenedioate decarboxylase
MPIRDQEAERCARQILAASASVSSLPPITDGEPDFDLHDAYRVAGRIIAARVLRGERPIGWKIGFTNRTIWDEYGVHAPIWAPIYDTTFASIDARNGPATCDLCSLAEPRIEPEIAFRVASAPHPDMDEHELLACIDGVAHGFEIVQSLFPGWRFRAPDTVAAFALHGCYRCGPLVAIGAHDRPRWFDMLTSFEIKLFRNGAEVDRGAAQNVLGGPLFALRHLVQGLAEHPLPRGLEPGDIVTTGTVTRAFPIAAGERWSTEIAGLPLSGLEIAFR